MPASPASDLEHAPADTPVARSVAIIMDGNGRWAERRGLPVAEGHRAGTKALRRTVEGAIDLGVRDERRDQQMHRHAPLERAGEQRGLDGGDDVVGCRRHRGRRA